jgi:D-lactate dehydrogenase
MKVIACDLRPRPEVAAELGFTYVTFEQLLADSDIISLHASLNPSSYHILDREAFAKCRPGVVILNTARAKLIDTNALIHALDQGIVGGAGLDVLGEESVMRRRAERIISDQIIQRLREPMERPKGMATDPLRTKEIEKLVRLGRLLLRPEVICTPHTAFNCVEAIERINRVTVENIKAFAAGIPINTLLPTIAAERTQKPGATEPTRPA